MIIICYSTYVYSTIHHFIFLDGKEKEASPREKLAQQMATILDLRQQAAKVHIQVHLNNSLYVQVYIYVLITVTCMFTHVIVT